MAGTPTNVQMVQKRGSPVFSRVAGASPAAGGESRFFSLGKTVGNLPVFSVFWTDGKKYRVIFSRAMTADELNFYDRRNTEFL